MVQITVGTLGVMLMAAANVAGVTITAHRNRVIGGSPCSAPVVYQCDNVGPRNCCGVPRIGNPFRGMLFSGLDTTGVPDQAAVFTTGTNTPCGRSCNADSGASRLCVSCSQTNPEIAGGYYIQLGRRVMERAEDGEKEDSDDCVTQLPDFAFIKGHKFAVYHDVPEFVSDRIIDLAVDDAEYEDVDEDLLKWEVFESSDETGTDGSVEAEANTEKE
ncbi:hypothetical protein LIA77_06058 [Sarocladium implicatum]|nr:hypothetical protein LIA77_06058 [Sarocladium implicatum]